MRCVLRVTNRLKIPLDKPVSRSVVSIKRNNKNARTIVITLTNNGIVYELDEVRIVAIKGKKPDGTEIYHDCIIKNNEIVYEIRSQTIACIGTVECELLLLGSNYEVIKSAKFSLEVTGEIFEDEVVESADEYTLLESCISECIDERIKCTKARDETEEISKKVDQKTDEFFNNMPDDFTSYTEKISDMEEDIEEIRNSIPGGDSEDMTDIDFSKFF